MNEIELPVSLYREKGEVYFNTVAYPAEIFSFPFLRHGRKHYDASKRPVVSRKYALDQLCEKQENEKISKPGGFVFHMSRCGSTLVSQMLAELEIFRAIAEPGTVNRYLSSGPANQLAFSPAIFRALLRAYGPSAEDKERHLFFKFSSWNTCFIRQIIEACPGTPWVFLVRNPVEVLLSNHKKPSGILRAYRSDPDLVHSFLHLPEHVFDFDNEFTFLASLFAYYFREVVEAVDQSGLILEYKDLPLGVTSKIVPHFGLTLRSEQREKMLLRSKRSSKVHGGVTPFKQNQYEIGAKERLQLEEAIEKHISGIWNRMISPE